MAHKAAYWISVYHVAIFVAVGLGLFKVYEDKISIAIYVLCFGALGGTLYASRYVVYSVRHRKYDTERLLWQILTPIHSAILAGIGVLFLHGGVIVIIAASTPAEPQYTWFVMGFSFFIGFASELFVKRLIMAAESFFGERGDLDEKE